MQIIKQFLINMYSNKICMMVQMPFLILRRKMIQENYILTVFIFLRNLDY